MNYHHLVYSGCGTYGGVAFSPNGMIGVLRRVCPNLFQRSINKDQIAYLFLRPELAELIFQINPDGSYRFRCTSIDEVRKLCSDPQDIHNRAIAAVPNLFDAIIGTEEENRELLLQRLPQFSLTLILASVKLTEFFCISSVGLAIGSAHLQAKTGLKVEVDYESAILEAQPVPAPSELF